MGRCVCVCVQPPQDLGIDMPSLPSGASPAAPRKRPAATLEPEGKGKNKRKKIDPATARKQELFKMSQSINAKVRSLEEAKRKLGNKATAKSLKGGIQDLLKRLSEHQKNFFKASSKEDVPATVHKELLRSGTKFLAQARSFSNHIVSIQRLKPWSEQWCCTNPNLLKSARQIPLNDRFRW